MTSSRSSLTTAIRSVWRIGARSTATSTTAGTLLSIQTSSGTGVTFVELQKDGSDVVNGNVHGIGNTRYG